MTGLPFRLVLKYGAISLAVLAGTYACFIGLLTTTWFQAHVVYLYKIQMTWFKDLNVPESFGFLRNQVTPFSISTKSGNLLYAWHILPIELYRRHETALLADPIGFSSDITARHSFKLLRDDPDARLVIHMHGAAGTVGSGYRVPNYRALSAGDPNKIHVLTFDYRGFGLSRGTPSEQGLIADAIAVVDWARTVAKIPASRILIYSQSLGTAVTLGVLEHFVTQTPPVEFAGAILTAPFADALALMTTYSVAGTIPLLAPLTRVPRLFGYLSVFVRDKWSSKTRIAAYIRACETHGIRYRLTLIHAKDDWDIPWTHTEVVFKHAVIATQSHDTESQELKKQLSHSRHEMSAVGSTVEWRTENGIIRKEILDTGLHDVVMSYPIVGLSVMRIFNTAERSSKK